MSRTKEGTLRIWHGDSIFREGYKQTVENTHEAIIILKALRGYDSTISDSIFSKGQGLEFYSNGEWKEYSDGRGLDIRDLSDDADAYDVAGEDDNEPEVEDYEIEVSDDGEKFQVVHSDGTKSGWMRKDKIEVTSRKSIW